MSNTMINNWINVRKGDRAFNILSNMCDYFQLGLESSGDIWLEGKIVEGEFIFNARLFLHDGDYGTLIDNFPKGPTPQGWTQNRRLDCEGFELLDNRGETVFKYHVDENVCHIDVNLFKADKTLAAHGGQGGLVSHVPTMLGRNGIHIA